MKNWVKYKRKATHLGEIYDKEYERKVSRCFETFKHDRKIEIERQTGKTFRTFRLAEAYYCRQVLRGLI